MACWKKTVHGPRCFGAECTIVPATGEELKELMARVCGLCGDFFIHFLTLDSSNYYSYFLTVVINLQNLSRFTLLCFIIAWFEPNTHLASLLILSQTSLSSLLEPK